MLDGEAALDVDAAVSGEARAPRRVTVAGWVAHPRVMTLPAHEAMSIEALVDRAGGSTAPGDAWVALDGGAYGGVLVPRDASPTSSVLLVLPAAHPLARRSRVTLASQWRRAASCCEGCRACTDLCPVALDGGSLRPHALLQARVSGQEARALSEAASACVGCGLCDAACPSGLSPVRLLTALAASPRARDLPRARVRTSSTTEPHPERHLRRFSMDLLLLRVGLLPSGRDIGSDEPATDGA